MAAFLDRIEAGEVERAVLDGDVDADYGLWLLDSWRHAGRRDVPHEQRVCGWCFGAGRFPFCRAADARPVMVSCSRCDATGHQRVYLYPTKRTRRA